MGSPRRGRKPLHGRQDGGAGADQAEFCHLLCRARRATRIVEIGTSCGVSTLYLAGAVRANGGGTVAATERDPAKAAVARATFEAAGLAGIIELREGDLRETLEGPVGFVLMNVWTEMAAPTMALPIVLASPPATPLRQVLEARQPSLL